MREVRLFTDDTGQFKNNGQILFTDVSKEDRRKPTAVGRVWLSEKGRMMRDADEAAARAARRRVLPRQHLQRIKRNV